METQLDKVINHMTEKYRNNILGNSRHYMEVSIGKEAEEMGYQGIQDKYFQAYAVVPLKTAVRGMKVRIDGRTFVNYEQFKSGIAVPGYVAKDSGLPHEVYVPHDSMICNFA